VKSNKIQLHAIPYALAGQLQGTNYFGAHLKMSHTKKYTLAEVENPARRWFY
jgi:hypothetical protein